MAVKWNYSEVLTTIAIIDLIVNYLTGTTITLCLNNETCFSCGVVPEHAPRGQWVEVKCANGNVTVNQVHLLSPLKPLSFCEVELYGKNNGKPKFELLLNPRFEETKIPQEESN